MTPSIFLGVTMTPTQAELCGPKSIRCSLFQLVCYVVEINGFIAGRSRGNSPPMHGTAWSNTIRLDVTCQLGSHVSVALDDMLQERHHPNGYLELWSFSSGTQFFNSAMPTCSMLNRGYMCSGHAKITFPLYPSILSGI